MDTLWFSDQGMARDDLLLLKYYLILYVSSGPSR